MLRSACEWECKRKTPPLLNGKEQQEQRECISGVQLFPRQSTSIDSSDYGNRKIKSDKFKCHPPKKSETVRKTIGFYWNPTLSSEEETLKQSPRSEWNPHRRGHFHIRRSRSTATCPMSPKAGSKFSHIAKIGIGLKTQKSHRKVK